MADGNGNGKMFTTGNVISILAAMGMVGGAYASLNHQMGINQRAIDDLHKVVYDLKEDTQDWEAKAASSDEQARARMERTIESMSTTLTQLRIDLSKYIDNDKKAK